MSSEMTTIEVTPEAAAVLRMLQAEAEARQLKLEDYLRQLAEKRGISLPPKPERSPQEKAAALRQWVSELSRDTPLLSDEAVSRESIYADEQR